MMPHLLRGALATLRSDPHRRKLGDTPRPPAERLRRSLRSLPWGHSLLGVSTDGHGRLQALRVGNVPSLRHTVTKLTKHRASNNSVWR